MMKLRNRIAIQRCNLAWAQAVVEKNHYLHRPVHQRAHPFAYSITLDGDTVGTLIMATPHFTRQRGLFGYPGLPTQWQVLVVARLWLDPAVQNCIVTDRHGQQHAPSIATCAIAKMIKRVNRDWLEHHPPVFPDLPYHIVLIMAYADRGAGHEGIIYQAANFQRWGTTRNSQPRHSTRGATDGGEKILYIYRLPAAKWIPTHQARLFA